MMDELLVQRSLVLVQVLGLQRVLPGLCEDFWTSRDFVIRDEAETSRMFELLLPGGGASLPP